MAIEIGSILKGKITSVTNFGAFVNMSEGKSGLVHISEISSDFVTNIEDVLTVGDEVEVKVIAVSDDGKIALSMKQAVEGYVDNAMKKKSKIFKQGNSNSRFKNNNSRNSDSNNFDAMMSSFLKSSEDRLSSLRKSNEGKRGGRRS